MLTLKKIKHQVLNAKYHQQEAEIVAQAGEAGTVTIATNMAGRGTDIKLTPESRAAGGLAIIGTERHESRRVDRQLRGRAGRQGDVGSSQFFVSFEDNLMRMGMNDTVQRFVDKLDEDDVIQSKMVARAIEKAQKKVEQNNYGFRKRLLEYDDVLNKQRDIIYKRRKVALEKKNVYTSSLNLLYFVAKNSIVKMNDESISEYEDASKIFHQISNEEFPIEKRKFTAHNAEKSTIQIYEKFVELYQQKCEQVDVILKEKFDFLFDVKGNYEDDDEYTFKFIKDGENIFVDANVGELRKNGGKELIRVLESTVTIFFIDKEWQNHLQIMDDLKHSVQHAHYEQKDPLLVYKLEAFSVFMEMVVRLNCEIVEFLLKANLFVEEKTEDDGDNDRLVLNDEEFSLDMIEKIRQKLGTHIG
jgi:preprotein translocase subunit SecA